eukprot:13774236-Alexandrium_andersonii.AAC.1
MVCPKAVQRRSPIARSRLRQRTGADQPTIPQVGKSQRAMNPKQRAGQPRDVPEGGAMVQSNR